MRLSSPSVAAAFIDGAMAQGAEVVDYGMMATDMMYFAVARDQHDGGAQITASHNPKEYNGIKMVGREAFPLSGDEGINDIRDMVGAGTMPAAGERTGRLSHQERASTIHRARDVVHRSVDHQAVQRRARRRQRHGGHGRAQALRRACPARRQARASRWTAPFRTTRRTRSSKRTAATSSSEVKRSKADIGIAWDGDADRCFFIDGSGEFIAGDFITALFAEAFLLRHPGAKIVYDVRASYAVKDIVAKYGGTALMNRVGHAFFKRRMREENAIFGGEVTGHYYFRDNFYADNGFIPALLILELMSKKGQTLRELLAPLREKYFISGEINTKVGDMRLVAEKLDALAARTRRAHLQLDGISAGYADWHFNVRASNTEPMLRLNLEAVTQELMEQKRDEVLALIRAWNQCAVLTVGI